MLVSEFNRWTETWTLEQKELSSADIQEGQVEDDNDERTEPLRTLSV